MLTCTAWQVSGWTGGEPTGAPQTSAALREGAVWMGKNGVFSYENMGHMVVWFTINCFSTIPWLKRIGGVAESLWVFLCHFSSIIYIYFFFPIIHSLSIHVVFQIYRTLEYCLSSWAWGKSKLSYKTIANTLIRVSNYTLIWPHEESLILGKQNPWSSPWAFHGYSSDMERSFWV